MSYLIHKDEAIAYTTKELKSGDIVSVSSRYTSSNIDMSRDYYLVNAFNVKVSNAKKWDKEEYQYIASPLNPPYLSEFLLTDNQYC